MGRLLRPAAVWLATYQGIVIGAHWYGLLLVFSVSIRRPALDPTKPTDKVAYETNPTKVIKWIGLGTHDMVLVWAVDTFV